MNTLIWILLLGVGAWWLFRVASRSSGGGGMGGGCCGGGGHSHHGGSGKDVASHQHGSSHEHAGTRQVSEAVVDPVCKMAIDKRSVVATLEYGGKTYYFCSSECYDKFKDDPESFVLAKEQVSRN